MDWKIKYTKGDNKPYAFIDGYTFHSLSEMDKAIRNIKEHISNTNARKTSYEQRGLDTHDEDVSLHSLRSELKVYQNVKTKFKNELSSFFTEQTKSSSRGTGSTMSSNTGK